MGEEYLGKYKILQVLKESPEVLVLLAEHIQLSSYWIIKKLNIGSDDTYREVEVLKNLRFKGIPLLADVVEEDGKLVIIREYMPGVTLQDYFYDYLDRYQTIGLSESHIVDIGLKLCEIMKYLHEYPEHPLIFRDLKPGNIVIDHGDNISLIDFGISRFYDQRKGRDTEYLGTRGFASPEQYGFGQSDVRTDVFGIGAVMYFLLTGEDMGKPPYRIHELENRRKDISKRLVNLVTKACSVNMANRHQDVNELMADLSSCHDSNTTSRNEIFHNFMGSILVMEHLHSGGGASYNSLMMAKASREMGGKPLLIDISGSLSFLEYQMNASFEGQIMIYENIPILSYPTYKSHGRHQVVDFTAYDCLVIDKGHEEVTYDFGDQSICFTSIQLSPWKLEVLEEHLLTKDRSFTYLISACTDNTFKQLNEEYDPVHMYHIPYQPFSESAETEVFCTILKEKGVASCLEKTKHTQRSILGLPFIKNIKL